MAVYTQQQYQALCAAIAQGVQSVQYGDKNITYRSLAEMKQVKADMEKELGVKSPTRKRYISHSKGFR